MAYQINSSINTIIINQAATSSITGNVEMIDVTYTNNNGTWTSTVPNGYTVVTPYFINSDNCVTVTTDNCENSIVTPQPGGGDDCPNPPCEDTPPEEDEDYPGSDDPRLIFNYSNLGVRLLDYIGSGIGSISLDDNSDICGKEYGMPDSGKDYIINNKLDILGDYNHTANSGYSGESNPGGNGYNIVLNNDSYYTCEQNSYYRPYELYSHMYYSTKLADCANNTESKYIKTSASSFRGRLCCNLFVDWNDFFSYLYNTYGNNNTNNGKEIIPTNETVTEIINCTTNTICLYFCTASIGDTKHYFTNLINPTTTYPISSLSQFLSVINTFVSYDENNNVIPVDGDTNISLFEMSINSYFDIISSNTGIITPDFALSTNWVEILNLLQDSDINGTTISLRDDLTKYIDDNTECETCGTCQSDDIYGSDGSVGGVEIKTKFAVICRFPDGKDSNDNWTYKYSVKCYDKTKSTSVKGSFIKPSVETITEITNPNDPEDTHIKEYKYSDNKYVIMDYPFPTGTTCSGNNVNINIKNGLYNTFNRSTSTTGYYKFSAGTVYNLIEDYTSEIWKYDGVITNEYYTYNYLKSGSTIKECEQGSKPSET